MKIISIVCSVGKVNFQASFLFYFEI
jgi:hypothetical protein